MQAATQGHVDVTEALLLAMNDPQDALLWAASEGYVQIVRGLVESRSAVGAGGKAGVSLSAKMGKMGKTGTTGTTGTTGKTGTEETLVVSYSETTYDEQQQGKAGGEAARKGAVGEKAGPDTPTDKDGNTALAMAALRGRTETVRLLLELGADPQRKNLAGLIAKDVALGITKGPMGAGPHNYRDDPGASEILQLLDGGSTRRDSRYVSGERYYMPCVCVYACVNARVSRANDPTSCCTLTYHQPPTPLFTLFPPHWFEH